MKIGIDARFAIHNRRGIGNYTLKLIQNLAMIDSTNSYILYIDRDDSDHLLPDGDNFEIRRLRPAHYPVWEQVALPLRANHDAVEILHCTGNTAPVFLSERIKLISSIMDVMYLKDYSEVPKSTSAYQRMGRLYRKIIVPRTAGRLSMALTISEFSKTDIMKHLPRLNPEAVRTVYLAANEGYRRMDKTPLLRRLKEGFGIDGDYILTLGAIDPRKNTALVVRTFLELKREQRIREKLLIVGIPDGKREQFRAIGRGSDFQGDISYIDFVSEADLVALYNCATLFLYPSLYEGFGIPPLEAMACGAPVITSATTSIPEVVGDAALLVDPRSGAQLKMALLKLLEDGDLRKSLMVRGLEQAERFSWTKTAEKTLQAYHHVYRTGKRTMENPPI